MFNMGALHSVWLRLAMLLALAATMFGDAPFAIHGQAQINYYACANAMARTAVFCPDAHAWSCHCTEPAAMATLAGCLLDGAPPDGSEQFILQQCTSVYHAAVLPDTWRSAYLNFTLHAKRVEEVPGFNRSIQVTVPLVLSHTLASNYRRAYEMFLGNYDRSFYYGVAMVAYWVVVMLFASAVHWTKWHFPRACDKLTGPVANRWRRRITIPATFHKHKTNEQNVGWLCTLLPSRLESIVLVGFLVVAVVCNACHYHHFKDDPVFARRLRAMLRYVADRTGITATVLVPMVILFAGRNNICQWATGWNYATYMTFHKWTARFMVVLVAVHLVCFAAICIDRGRLLILMHERYMIYGTVATVAAVALLVQATLALRRRWYETFLLLHIALAVAFIGGSWVHVRNFGYSVFFIISSGVWGLDRLVRICRLVYFGCPRAQVSLLANDTLKVVVRRPKLWKPIPGGHAFLHFMRPSCFWQSHPFTFTALRGKIVMYLKVKGGVTHSLYRHLLSQPGHTAAIRVSLEGPYGEATQAKRFDNAVFVAGGNGIPGIYAEVVDLASRAATRQVLKLHWVIRDYSSLDWFYDELMALKESPIQCTVHVTQPEPVLTYGATDDLSTVLSEDEQHKYLHERDSLIPRSTHDARQLRAELGHIQFQEGRPSIKLLVGDEIDSSHGSVAFVTCGHPAMVDELRYQVANSLAYVSNRRIDFFEQLQVWA